MSYSYLKKLDNIQKEQFKIDLIREGYYQLTETEEFGMCALYNFIFTTEVVIGIDNTGYNVRYCYESRYDAIRGLEDLVDNNISIKYIFPWVLPQLSGPWIKCKGIYGDFSNYELKE